jgi:hypothetical protein
MPGPLPNFLKVWWVGASPFAVLFAARILWEKTIWTWSRGPQMVGFSLWHIHSEFALVGILGSLALARCSSSATFGANSLPLGF